MSARPRLFLLPPPPPCLPPSIVERKEDGRQKEGTRTDQMKVDRKGGWTKQRTEKKVGRKIKEEGT
jgi:hypothetical protein